MSRSELEAKDVEVVIGDYIKTSNKWEYISDLKVAGQDVSVVIKRSGTDLWSGNIVEFTIQYILAKRVTVMRELVSSLPTILDDLSAIVMTP